MAIFLPGLKRRNSLVYVLVPVNDFGNARKDDIWLNIFKIVAKNACQEEVRAIVMLIVSTYNYYFCTPYMVVHAELLGFYHWCGIRRSSLTVL